jgi:MarR family transcriptional regulator, organic hydroperoxide resistance regulator
MSEPSIPPRSRLVEELQQTRPFPSVAQEALVGIARTASVVDRATARLLGPYGLSTAQYNVLRILRGAGSDGLATLAIRDRMIDPAAAITRLVDKLEESGHISRERLTEDRRSIRCRITPRGLAVLAELDPQLVGVDEQIAAVLTPDEVQALIGLLDRIRCGLT